MNKGIYSLDYVDHVCNYNMNNLNENGECLYGGNCRRKCIIYKATCQITNRFYVGSTANGLKTRMNGHYNDVKKILDGELVASDTFSRHFARVFKEKFGCKHNITQVKSLVKCEILWQGNPISLMKTFGTNECRLCAEEKLAILYSSSRRNSKLLNKCSEIHSCCRHKSKFHQYASTDELLRRKGILFESAWSKETRSRNNTKNAV